MRPQSSATVLALVALLGIGVAALGMLYAVNPAGSIWYPKCPVHLLTGLHCPGCGAMRGAHQLLQGNVAAAISMNTLAFLLLPPLAISWVVNLIRQSGLCKSAAGPPRRLLPDWTGWVLLAVVVAFTIARNIPYEPFVYLAPS